MSSILSDRSWVLDTRGVNGTVVIGASFIFLAYVLHPAVESAYSRVRAYRAWRSIEMRQSVEVTNYSLMAELFGGRRRWDAARIITALLAVFSLASWGLELSMELATHTGVTDLLNRPPPVEVVNDTSGANVWKVKSRADLDYDGEWSRLPGMFHERAKSRYNKAGRFINGEIPVAIWNEEPNDELFYFTGDTTTTVEGLNCTGDGASNDRKGVYLGDELWGSVFSCDNGPRLTSGLQTQIYAKDATPPTIVLNHGKDQKAFLIVEESSSYPSFHYSIWTVVGTETGGSVELQHMFHIAATMRMAEAVVTGIVHGETTGGGCFGLLRQYSDLYPSYDNEALRAFPFGERPDGDSNERIEDLETIEYGLKVGADALMCFVWIMLLTTIGAVWSICLYSSTGMDVYDRDELIRAVTLHEVAPGARPPSDIRIFVRREDTGSISVVISDTGTADNGCRQFFRRDNQVVEDIEPSPVAAIVDQYNRGFGGVGVPMGPRTMWLEGVRMGMSRALPGPNGDFQYPMTVELNGSPVPSNIGSIVSTPMPSPSQRSFVPPGGSGPAAGRGTSAMFDSDSSPGNSPEETRNGMPTARYGSTVPSEGVSGAYNATIDGERPTLANSQATSASDTERSRLSNRSVGNRESVTSPVSPDMKSPERRGLGRGIQQPRGRTHDSDDDTEECTSSSENLDMETKECSPSCETRSIGDE